jgi:hypothetical protein
VGQTVGFRVDAVEGLGRDPHRGSPRASSPR